MSSPVDRLIVIADLGGGGAQKVAVALARAWKNAGHSVGILTLSSEGLERWQPLGDIRHVSLEATNSNPSLLRKITGNIRRIYKLRLEIKAFSPKTVISFVAGMNILTILACLGLRLRVVISERNDPRIQNIGMIWKIFRRVFYRFADRVTANSQSAIETMRAFVPSHKLVLTPNWIDQPSLVSSPSQTLLAVGRLHYQKAYDILLRGFAQSDVFKKGWKLVILGDGPEGPALQALGKTLGLENSVNWAGFVSDPREWYSRASIFVLASRFEGLPNVVLEAAAQGVPMVLSDSCVSCLEFLENEKSCLIVPVENPVALAQAMDWLATHPEYAKQMAMQAQQVVISQFERAKILTAWERALAKE